MSATVISLEDFRAAAENDRRAETARSLDALIAEMRTAFGDTRTAQILEAAGNLHYARATFGQVVGGMTDDQITFALETGARCRAAAAHIRRGELP